MGFESILLKCPLDLIVHRYCSYNATVKFLILELADREYSKLDKELIDRSID